MWWILCPLTVLLLSLYTPEPVDMEALLIKAGGVRGAGGAHLLKTCAEVTRRRGHPRIGLRFWVNKLRLELQILQE